MSEEKNKKRSIVPSQNDPGFVTNLARQVRLVRAGAAEPAAAGTGAD